MNFDKSFFDAVAAQCRGIRLVFKEDENLIMLYWEGDSDPLYGPLISLLIRKLEKPSFPSLLWRSLNNLYTIAEIPNKHEGPELIEECAKLLRKAIDDFPIIGNLISLHDALCFAGDSETKEQFLKYAARIYASYYARYSIGECDAALFAAAQRWCAEDDLIRIKHNIEIVKEIL